MRVQRQLALLALPFFYSEGNAIPLNRKICPALTIWPKPTNIGGSSLWTDTVKTLDEQIDHALQTHMSPDGNGPFKEISFSIGFFATNEDTLLYERYQTTEAVAQSSSGTHHIDGDSIYQIGSISKLLTMYTFLLNGGNTHLYDPITDFIPELLEAVKGRNDSNVYGLVQQWDQVAVIDIASHTAGILEDYGLDDVEIDKYPYKGLPPLPKSRIPVCNTQTRTNYTTCTKQELINGIANQPPIFQIGSQPSYSNAGYDLMGFVVEGLTGRSMSENFNESIVKPLNLKNTYYGIPGDDSNGVIPISQESAQWNVQYGPTIPDGANFVSTNDFATIGRAMMNSTLLPRAVTNRWIKPHVFTADIKAPVGAPWEIWTWPTSLRNYILYTKEGENGVYATLFTIVPDLGVGFTVMTAGDHDAPAAAVEAMTGIVANATLPAVDAIAKEEANKNFGGRYKSSRINSSVVVTTDDQPGLKVTEWISNGTDFLQQLKGDNDPHTYIDFRLWPNELYSGNQVGFLGAWQNFPANVFPKSPIEEDCQSWTFGDNVFGNVNLGAFLFATDNNGVAQSLTLQAFPITMEKES